ncbi:hypothetical protein SAMN04487975_12417 [Planococcus glaciei]|uniref:hypothetical protein n=1 Tax=Planococcus glaciei TaxID=459472 RepID=UPI0008835CFC|nr:hypothetical protein [Planococcus glaciei]SDI64714.1 hypothetical protein SAMN04487975_12417 [Planococcus glaciei]
MDSFNSTLLSAIYANDKLIPPMAGVLKFKKNLLGGSTLTDENGTTILETTPSAAGGETVMFTNGETAHLSENVYGSATLDFTGTTPDIVGTASIFGAESFEKGGVFIGTTIPNFAGDGVVFSNSASESLLTSSPDFFGNTLVAFSSPFIEQNFPMSSLDLQNSFVDIEAILSQFSLADLSSTIDAVDGLDFLGLF